MNIAISLPHSIAATLKETARITGYSIENLLLLALSYSPLKADDDVAHEMKPWIESIGFHTEASCLVAIARLRRKFEFTSFEMQKKTISGETSWWVKLNADREQPFSISDKVVCVDDSNIQERHSFTSLPQRGAIYVVRGVEANGLFLVGIQGVIGQKGEIGFSASRFRRLQDIKRENATAPSAKAKRKGRKKKS